MKTRLITTLICTILSIPLCVKAHDFPNLKNKKDFIDVFYAVLNGKKEVEVNGKKYGIEYTKGNSSKDVQKKMNQAFNSIGGTVNFAEYDRTQFEALLQTVNNVLNGNPGFWDLVAIYNIMYQTHLTDEQQKELKDKGKQKSIWDIIFTKRDAMPPAAKDSYLELTGFKTFSYLTKFDGETHKQGYRVKIFNASDKVMDFEDIEIYLTHGQKDEKHKK